MLAAAATAALAGGPALPSAPDLMPPPVLKALQGSGLPLASFGVYARPIDAARPVTAVNAEAPYVLASTAKLVTSMAALDLLGDHWRWRTHAFVTGPVSNGRLLGDLIIVGGGDTRLTSADLTSWMQRMRTQGLEEVWGDILVDRSAFTLRDGDHQHTPEPAPDRPHHLRPDALLVDGGVLQVTVAPTRGPLAEVQTVPSLAGVSLVNKVVMKGGCHASARWQPGAKPQLAVEGSWGTGCGPRVLAMLPPTESGYATHVIAGLWREAGGRLRGKVRGIDLTGGQRDRTRLPFFGADGEALLPWSTFASEPLPEIVREMNKTSDNLAARSLMLALARDFPVRTATLPRAQERVHDWLQRQGLAPGDIEIENGSGLSRAERGKPRALVQLLVNAWKSRQANAFVESLPVAGVDGTLQHRMQGGPAAGQAFLKTGTLLDARALAGYVRSASGTVYAVAALVNHPEAARATPALDAFIEWLAKSG